MAFGDDVQVGAEVRDWRAETLQRRFDPRANAIGLLRLFLALVVLVAHSLHAGGFGGDIGRRDNNLGTLAVEGFFALSGFLIVRSALRDGSTVRFLWRRCLRILPAYWVALLLIALVLSPVVARASGEEWSLSEAASYVVRNAALSIRQTGIGGTLASNPYPRDWNVPVWTLGYEFRCYLLVAVLAGLRGLRNPRVLLILAAGSWCYLQVEALGGDDRPTRFVLVFLLGALMSVRPDLVPVRPRTVTAAVLVAIATYVLGGFQVVGLPALAYVVVCAGALLPFHRVGVARDLSYGVYVYAWPVQQALFAVGVGALGWPVYVTSTLVVVLPLAAASWLLVEGPALRLKGGR